MKKATPFLDLYRELSERCRIYEEDEDDAHFCDLVHKLTGVSEADATDLYRPACPFETYFMCVEKLFTPLHANILLILAADAGEL